MKHTTIDRPAPAESERLINKGLDALRQVSDLSDEARRLKSVAADAIGDGVHTVKRTAKTLRQDAVDVPDEVTYRVKREPTKALAVAFAVGTLAGLLLGAFRPRNGRAITVAAKRRAEVADARGQEALSHSNGGLGAVLGPRPRLRVNSRSSDAR